MENEKPTEQPSSSRDRVRRYRERKRKGNELATQRISPSAIRLALEEPVERVHYPIRIPVIPKGVAPHGVTPQVAMDSEPAYECARLAMDAGPQFGSQLYAYSNIEGFPGYPYLMLLALRSEYRNMATALATELTRKWIKFNSTDTEDESTKTKITEIEQAFTALGIQGIIRKAAEHDAFYGTGQILINIKGADLKTPLIIDPRTVKKDSLIGFKNVDPIWTTPLMYNSLTPSSPNFYRPDSWWVMGEHWDASRVIVTVTREVPDIFKPAFNFSGMSLSQLAEPYVNNWLRTRQSVSDLINNFSIVVLKTAMDQVLTGGDDGSNLFSRIKLFTATRSNKGVMALDKDREELEQIAVPLGGLHELQSQALEQLCVVSREPATVLTGITPSGFGNVAEGEVRIWYDYIHAQQEAHWRSPIDKMFKIIQMSMYGEIDPEITFEFVPLYEMTEEQKSNMRVNDSVRAGNLIDRGVIDAQEERERLARDPESGYQGIDITKEIAPPDEAEEGANLARGTDSALGMDADFVESEHPRAPDGRFGDKPGEQDAKTAKQKFNEFDDEMYGKYKFDFAQKATKQEKEKWDNLVDAYKKEADASRPKPKEIQDTKPARNSNSAPTRPIMKHSMGDQFKQTKEPEIIDDKKFEELQDMLESRKSSPITLPVIRHSNSDAASQTEFGAGGIWFQISNESSNGKLNPYAEKYRNKFSGTITLRHPYLFEGENVSSLGGYELKDSSLAIVKNLGGIDPNEIIFYDDEDLKLPEGTMERIKEQYENAPPEDDTKNSNPMADALAIELLKARGYDGSIQVPSDAQEKQAEVIYVGGK